MIVIEDTLISENLLDKRFVCNLSACKGACCVEGDRGAPLLEEEIGVLQALLPAIKPYMDPDYLLDTEANGFYEKDEDGEFVTRCQPSGECNFVVYQDGITACSIELAHKAGAIDYKKPISCHLYPVRVQRYKEFQAVNYHEWSICSPACQLGDELKVPVYRFVKDALIRKFGIAWYEALEATAAHLETNTDSPES